MRAADGVYHAGKRGRAPSSIYHSAVVVTLVVYTRKAMCDVALSRLGSVAANQWYCVSLGGRRSLSPGGTFHIVVAVWA